MIIKRPGPDVPNLEVPRAQLGERIRSVRIAAKLTQEALAEQAAVTVGTISRIERGKFEPSLTTAARLAEVLDADPGYLILGRGPADAQGDLEERQLVATARRLPLSDRKVLLDLARSLRRHRGDGD